jgi:hypothetical protein
VNAALATVSPTALADAALTEKGLVSLDVVWGASEALSFAAGVITGRLWSFAVPPALIALVVGGVALDWWGGGLGDQWWTVAVAFMLIAGLLLAAGIGAFHLGARLIGGRLATPAWAWRTAVVGVVLIAVAGFWYASTRAPDVAPLVARTGADLYYLGDEFEGYRLTHADAGPSGALFVYGDCESRLGLVDGGCSPPLQLQEKFTPRASGERSADCPPAPQRAATPGSDPSSVFLLVRGTAITIYAHDRAQALRAARAIRPVCP